ncbi:glycosyltransferase [Ramlibacter tataouinensis]|uniref:A-glycosyltransferase, Glycosyltransferase Family 4-like protein n=1 Tax=Ramlibacter tataouinensis (strain ATCC BAA-407 / DSM 14655 / LMG 21543 / TTB310) TaxID=365046 RepID=F5XY66_RAMTT|nr:glycosyltransferase [Ramlibacter tataouinensis]AEG94391.1 a-glycosyltransferase, Glycosyltransferase Family 4-like protein [Ramlibacter tataouinensis TTB310]
MQTLVVFSHLRWNFVYQRPQHLLSRLAARWRVVFIEEPMLHAQEPHLERIKPCPGVQVWRPHVKGDTPGFHDDHLPVLQQMVMQAMAEENVKDYWVWFYTPMAYPLASEMTPRGVVYDCMDELAAFKNAPRQLLQRENALFKAADLVFTGGPSLYQSKRTRHPSVHCFPSSVDAKHFARNVPDHPLQAQLPHPRVGYCGVIDERVDLGMVAALADARPEWQVVMVGPVVKIDPASIPQRPNIHWLGQQSYDDLPAFISGWDVCMLPFALNEATRFISPTKTLEYMACGRPSVSTAIKDVVEPYGHVVPIVSTPEEFVAACDEILARTPELQLRHAKALAEVVARTSWDATANGMAELIAQADQENQAAKRAAAAPAVGASRPASAMLTEPLVAARRAVVG